MASLRVPSTCCCSRDPLSWSTLGWRVSKTWIQGSWHKIQQLQQTQYFRSNNFRYIRQKLVNRIGNGQPGKLIAGGLWRPIKHCIPVRIRASSSEFWFESIWHVWGSILSAGSRDSPGLIWTVQHWIHRTAIAFGKWMYLQKIVDLDTKRQPQLWWSHQLRQRWHRLVTKVHCYRGPNAKKYRTLFKSTEPNYSTNLVLWK